MPTQAKRRSWQIVLVALVALPLLLVMLLTLQPLAFDLIATIATSLILALCFAYYLPRLKHTPAALLLPLSLLWLFANYLFANFVSFYLQGTGLNQQFFFHFNIASLTETWGAYWPLTLFYIVWSGLLLVSGYQLSCQRTDHSQPRNHFAFALVVLALLINPDVRLASAFSAGMFGFNAVSSVDQIDWQRTGLNPEALQRGSTAIAGKNLLVIYMEGVDSVYTDETVFPGLTPNLNRFAASGLTLTNMRQVSGSEWTVGGLIATSCGTPLLQETSISGNTALFSSLLNETDCLGDILARADYRQTFMGGASLNFAGKGRFFKSHQFDRILGREELLAQLPDPDYVNGWGLYDDSLFAMALKEFDTLSASASPFNLTLLTVDTHHPNGEPSASCPAYPTIDNSILHSVHCTDYLIGNFIDSLEQHPAFADTLVVLMSDHLAMRNNAFGLFPEGYERKRLFIALNSEIKGSIDTLASPMDVAPTILELIGVQHDSQFLAGGNLLQDSHRAISNTVAINSEISYINSNLLTANPETEVFSIEKNGIAAFSLDNSIAGFSSEDNGLRVTADGLDPYFSLLLLPPETLRQPENQSVHITVYSPEPTTMEIYYAEDPRGEFTEAQKTTINLETGLNQVWAALPEDRFYRRIRIDPGQVPGDYVFESLVIMASDGV